MSAKTFWIIDMFSMSVEDFATALYTSEERGPQKLSHYMDSDLFLFIQANKYHDDNERLKITETLAYTINWYDGTLDP